VVVSTRAVVEVGNTHLEVDLLGHGEPVVVVQTALNADELLPLSEQIARAGHRVIHYHRRGYAGSAPLLGPHSLASEASDCHDLIATLGEAPVHVVGVSFSAAIALAVASTYPASVRTVTIIEPPPVRSTNTEEFFALSARLVESSRTRGVQVALSEFMEVLLGPDWREVSERDLPGSVAQMERDARTFFEADLPALLTWDFGPPQATTVRCPVLYVAGEATPAWFVDAQTRLPALLPQTELRFVSGAGHLVATTHLAKTSELVAEFLARHSTPR
jgi:pimeloyl-ACP methyl ester carboxylesterase